MLCFLAAWAFENVRLMDQVQAAVGTGDGADLKAG
jgi:hypothetical protein